MVPVSITGMKNWFERLQATSSADEHNYSIDSYDTDVIKKLPIPFQPSENVTDWIIY